MKLRGIEGIDLSGKKILLRVDFNVELNDIKNVAEHFKLDIAKPTIDSLLQSEGTKVALVTHFGRPAGEKDAAYSLGPVADDAERALGRTIHFVEDCVGEKVAQALEALPEGELLLLENVRFYPGDEANDPDFASQLAAPFDVFINEAFSVCHRDHASVTGVTKFLPSYAGFRLFEEIKKLEQISTAPARPAVAVIGGAKIETKLPLIQALEKEYDAVLVGGKVANEALDHGIQFSEKVLLPQDFQGETRLDIGPKTALLYAEIIKRAKTIIWNGPMGKFEEKPYDMGTQLILQAMMDNANASVVVGGGESLAVLEAANVMHHIGFVSTGGGAMLKFLSGETMPGLEVLREEG